MRIENDYRDENGPTSPKAGRWIISVPLSGLFGANRSDGDQEPGDDLPDDHDVRNGFVLELTDEDLDRAGWMTGDEFLAQFAPVADAGLAEADSGTTATRGAGADEG